MRDFPRIVLTHANTLRKVHLLAKNVDFFTRSEKDKCTHVFFQGQNIFPAVETEDEINKLFDTLEVK